MLNVILSLGLIIIIGLLSSRIFNKIKLPSVTAYIVCGILMGPYILNLISKNVLNASGLVSNIALSFIAFSLGQNFTLYRLRRIGKSVFAISIGEVLGAFIIVTLSVWLLLGKPFYVAIVIGAIAPATAPAAVVMITREYRAKGTFTDTLLGVVAIDDAWGIILFAFSLALAKTVAGTHGGVFATLFPDLLHGFMEVFGSLFLGFILGGIFSYFFRFLKTPAHLLIYVIGFILLTGGLSIEFNLSVLLSNMMLGATVANLSKTENRAFEILKGFDPPIYLLFFVLAGANLEIANLTELGLTGIIYVLTRLPGEMLGAFLGALVSKAEKRIKKYIGLGLAPQAGVAIGLALLAKAYLPKDAGEMILSTIIVTTVIYELIGPPLVRIALERAGEIGSSD